MTIPIEHLIPNDYLLDQARWYVLSALGDGQWQSVEDLCRRRPYDQVEARVKPLLNPGIIGTALESLEAESCIESHTVGGRKEVRLEPTGPEAQRLRETMVRLTRAFRKMRNCGLLAKENFACCWTCGIEEITELATSRVDAGREVLGYVFYDMQDNMERCAGGDFHLVSGQFYLEGLGKVGISSTAVGKLVCYCLKKCGVAYEWDEEENTYIRVKVRADVPLPR